jgi:hypothetical protein
MPITLSEYLLTTLAIFPFLFTCVYIGSVGGFLVDAGGQVDRAANGASRLSLARPP